MKKAGTQAFETLLWDEAAQPISLLEGIEPNNLNNITGSLKKILISLTVQPMSSTIWKQVWSTKPVKARASSWQQYGLALASDKCENTPSVWHSPLSQHGHVVNHFRHNPVFLKTQLAAWYKERFQNKAFYFPLVGTYYLQAVSRRSNQPSPSTHEEQLKGPAPTPTVHWLGKYLTSLGQACLHCAGVRLHTLPHLLFRVSKPQVEGMQIVTTFNLP